MHLSLPNAEPLSAQNLVTCQRANPKDDAVLKFHPWPERRNEFLALAFALSTSSSKRYELLTPW
jgi:hypothetical protein